MKAVRTCECPLTELPSTCFQVGACHCSQTPHRAARPRENGAGSISSDAGGGGRVPVRVSRGPLAGARCLGPRAFRRQADLQRREPWGCADGVSHGQQRGAREGDKERPRAEPTSVIHTPNSREEGAERSKRRGQETPSALPGYPGCPRAQGCASLEPTALPRDCRSASWDAQALVSRSQILHLVLSTLGDCNLHRLPRRPLQVSET